MPPRKKTQTTQEIIREILPLTDKKRIDPSAFLNLAARLGISECEPKIYFLRELCGIARQLPIKGFATAGDRLTLIETLQQALDEAVDEEEEQLSNA